METSIWMVISSHLNDSLIEMHTDRNAAADRIRFAQELIRRFSVQKISARVTNEELDQIWESMIAQPEFKTNNH